MVDVTCGDWYYNINPFIMSVTICPVLNLNVASVVLAKNLNPNSFKIDTIKNQEGKEIYHTIEFGEYPKSYVGENLNSKLEKELSLGRDEPKQTGKQYTGRIEFGNRINYYDEYEYCGQKYVRVKVDNFQNGNFYSDKSKLKDGEFVWIKVEPILWKIRNWNDLPNEFNSNSNGSSEFIEVVSVEGIATLPFYSNGIDKYGCLW